MSRVFLTLASLTALCVPAAAQAQARSALDFSGVIFANYQWRTDAAARNAAAGGGQPANRFDLQRVYLTFRMPAGEKGSIRVTTDMFQQGSTPANSFYAGWAVRLKYAYFQYDATRALAGVDGLAAVARFGMLHNVIVEHVDAHWPRWMGIDALETHGYFASADVGAAGLFTLPARRGEVYLTVVNGNGYTAAETDRFKDIAGRFTWVPFAGDSGFLRTVSITPWYSRGATASQFVNGGAGQVGRVGAGLQRDRGGLFAGVRDRRLTAGLGVSSRIEGVESGANTVASPRAVRTRTSSLVDGFALVRPFELLNPSRRSPFGLVGRYDRFKLDKDAPATNDYVVAGIFYDLNERLSLAVDLQELRPRNGSPTPATRTWFLHWVANF